MNAELPAEKVWTPQLLASPHDVVDKASRVRRMFDHIAPRYALVNSIFSAGRDAAWRRQAAALSGAGPGDDVLDVACGTGDFARAFLHRGVRRVVGCDFSHQMLVQASGAAFRRKAGSSRFGQAPACKDRGSHRREPQRSGKCSWCEADAMRLPFRDASFSVVSCAFGVRNFADLDAGLAEMRRVLRPDGRIVILEFSTPSHRFARRVYQLYAAGLMPLAATLISGDRTGAYRYLPRSVASFFHAGQMCERLVAAGFREPTATALTIGIVTVYTARRSRG